MPTRSIESLYEVGCGSGSEMAHELNADAKQFPFAKLTNLHPRESMNANNVESFEVFVAYSREDESLQRQLLKHLSALRREGLISVWYDRCITPGSEWQSEISKHLDDAAIVLLLITAGFIDSEYCYGIEMKRALERHESGEAVVIPVILKDVDWAKTPLGKLQALPRDGRPVSSWPNVDEAFADVSRGLRASIARLIARLEEHSKNKSEFPRMDILSSPKLPPLSG
jgi:hypothetical protein